MTRDKGTDQKPKKEARSRRGKDDPAATKMRAAIDLIKHVRRSATVVL